MEKKAMVHLGATFPAPSSQTSPSTPFSGTEKSRSLDAESTEAFKKILEKELKRPSPHHSESVPNRSLLKGEKKKTHRRAASVGKGKEKEKEKKKEKDKDKSRAERMFLSPPRTRLRISPSPSTPAPQRTSIASPRSTPSCTTTSSFSASTPSTFRSTPSTSPRPPPPPDSPTGSAPSVTPSVEAMKKDMPASIAIPSSETSKAYLALYYDNLARSQTALSSLKGLGVTSLETHSLGKMGTSGLSPSIRRTIDAINNGTLRMLTIGGSSDSGWELWKRWRDLLGDVFFFFEYSFEDGEGDDTGWSYFQRHDFNPRISMKQRLKFRKNCTIYDKVRRVEIFHPLAREDKQAVDETEKKKLTTSQFAYRTRKHIERSLLLDSQEDTDTDTEDQDFSDFEIDDIPAPVRRKSLPNSQPPIRSPPLASKGLPQAPTQPARHNQKSSSPKRSRGRKMSDIDDIHQYRDPFRPRTMRPLSPNPPRPIAPSATPPPMTSPPPLSPPPVTPPTLVTTPPPVTPPVTPPPVTPLPEVLALPSQETPPRSVTPPSDSSSTPPISDSDASTPAEKSPARPSFPPSSSEDDLAFCSLLRLPDTPFTPFFPQRAPSTPVGGALNSSEEDETSTIVTLSATIETGGEGLLPGLSIPMEKMGRDPSVNLQPLKNGDLFVRFFGMKDNDGFFTRGNLLVAHIPDGTKEKKGKLGIHSHGMACHGGFYEIWEKIKRGSLSQHQMDTVAYIYSKWKRHPSGRIILVGHSMGACLTCIAAYQLVNRHPELKEKIFIVNLGSPLFARKGFCEWIDENIEVLNVCLVGDPTVALPGLPFTGWYSPGRRLWISPQGATLYDQPHAHFQYWELLRVLLLRF